MRALVASLLLSLAVLAPAAAPALEVGQKAPDFQLQDSTGKQYSLEAPEFRGKVLSIFYVDPDEADMNEHVSEALKEAADKKVLDRNNYKGFGVSNLKATWMPNFLLKSIVKRKQKKYNTIILLDYDFTLLNLWNLRNDSSNLVILDKEGYCRYLYRGRIPEAEIATIIGIIQKYQTR